MKLSRPSPLPAPPPQRGTYALLAVGFLLFVIYGSLVPLHYRPLPWNEAVARFHSVCAEPVRFDSISDWLTNILLFVPLGFLGMATLCSKPDPNRKLSAALGVLPACVLLSASIEFVQIWFPPRVSSMNDVVAESLGAALGVWVWWIGGHRLTTWVQQTWRALTGEGWAAQILPIYLGVLLVIQSWPLDLTIRPAELWHKYRAGHIHIVPFTSNAEEPWLMLAKQLQNVLYFAPIGVLLASLQHFSWRVWSYWPRTLLVAFGITGTVEVLQFFVESRICDATDVISGTLVIFGGWAATLALVPDSRMNPRKPSTNVKQSVYWLLLGLCLSVLVILNWQPFDFTLDPVFLTRRFESLSLLPFADYQRADIVHAADQMSNKVFVWVPVGALLTLAFARTSERSALISLLLAATFAAYLEVGQFFLRSRYASISDVILETAGAAIGIWFVRQS